MCIEDRAPRGLEVSGLGGDLLCRRGADRPISSLAMVTTPPADGDSPGTPLPASAASGEPPEGDILDSTQAGASVIRGGLLRLGGMLLGTLATLVSSAVVIRHLGKVNTGRYVTVSALIVIAASFSDLGLSAIGVREYSVRPNEEGRRFLGNLLGIRIALMLAGLALAVGF